MSEFKLRRAETVKTLAAIQNQVGFVPNVFAVLGGNEKALEAFIVLNNLFGESSLSPIEREILQSAVSVTNNCAYCVVGHSALTHRQKLDLSQINAIREGAPLSGRRYEALRCFAQALVVSKGRGAQKELQAFLDAGYERDQVFDVVLGVNVKMFSNHIAGLTDIPLDDAFAPFRWVPADQAIHAA